MRLQICILSFLLLVVLTLNADETLVVKVTKVEGDTLTLDAGSNQGLKVGLKGRVYYEYIIGGEVKRVYIANISLIAVQSDESSAKVEEKTAAVKPGHFAEIEGVQKAKGFLYVTSSPKGADISLDGEATGKKTPAQIKVSAGSHTVEARLKGYELASQAVQVAANKVSRVEFQLTQGKGTLTVLSEPLEAEVYLDGKLRGSTPLTIEGIPTGEHTLELRKQGYAQHTETIRMLNGKPMVLQRTLAPEGMVLIPAGEFQMGSNDGFDNDKPVHTVYLDAYYIDVYEVTNAQYAKFLNEHGKNTDTAGHKLLNIDALGCLIEKVGNAYKPKAGYENHPVVEVSWYGAAAYAQFYGKRLPTEAEWEKAARGGLVGKRYPWGDNITHDDANYYVANFGTDCKDKWTVTSPVGSFAPNGYGLYDMAGNVAEWCADEYDPGYYSLSPKNNPMGPGTVVTFKNNDFTNVTSLRVMRGGSWRHKSKFQRCAFRDGFELPSWHRDIGFRCSQDM